MTRTLIIFLALCGSIFADEGRKTVGIIGGTAARNGQFPYQVVILRFMGVYCGGSLITNNVVLTAAHCEVDDVRNFKVLAGTVNYKRPQDGQIRNMVNFLPHANYYDASEGFDIALVKVNSPFTLNSFVALVALNSVASDPAGSCIATGWGLTRDGDDSSIPDIMQTVTLSLLKNSDCAVYWDGVPAGTICAALPGKDTCQGDSGGPLVANVGGKMVQVGITSYGAECAHPDLPGVYTSVGKYITWINSMRTRV